MMDISKRPEVIQAINAALNTGENVQIEVHNGVIVVLAYKKKQKVLLKTEL